MEGGTMLASDLTPSAEELLADLIHMGFDRDGAAALMQNPRSSAFRLECAIASAMLNAKPGKPRVDHVSRFVARQANIGAEVVAKKDELRRKRASQRRPRGRMTTAPAQPTPPASGPDVRDWIRSTTREHRERLRDELLANPAGVDPFIVGYIETHPDTTNRTVATALMHRDTSTKQEAA